MTERILVLTRDQEKYLDELHGMELENAEIFAPINDADIEQIVSSATIILGDSPQVAKWISKASSCKWVQSTFAGIDALIKPDLPTGYQLTNVKDTYGDCMAEFVLAYILFFEKRIQEHQALQAQREWCQRPYEPMNRLTVGIMGTGSIGSVIAKYCKMLGCATRGYRKREGQVEYFDEMYTRSNEKNFFTSLDFLISVLPHTSETVGSVNENVFSQLPEQAVFINVGRGSVVEINSLVQALSTKKLKAAVLDVFEEEPLPSDSALWNIENLYITPHVSGYQINRRIFDIFAENYQRYIAGEALRYTVDFSKGY